MGRLLWPVVKGIDILEKHKARAYATPDTVNTEANIIPFVQSRVPQVAATRGGEAPSSNEQNNNLANSKIEPKIVRLYCGRCMPDFPAMWSQWILLDRQQPPHCVGGPSRQVVLGRASEGNGSLDSRKSRFILSGWHNGEHSISYTRTRVSIMVVP
ncbi:hypothetical protein D915_007029 [Fasciola hepatica]|uniref:Uncharacterized protein n=1 Tax=Fasciola hepatica TaxID=6192 RepID=A0A4E0R404_FASHE|nr:hypothetical protein D915_007029 [Fasciola hepatica]